MKPHKTSDYPHGKQQTALFGGIIAIVAVVAFLITVFLSGPNTVWLIFFLLAVVAVIGFWGIKDTAKGHSKTESKSHDANHAPSKSSEPAMQGPAAP
jgi:UDP-N-acetylmuramyl pentapeptide phosphotransferase/UDP-N-acetylglucosamine-1-phosphate transferase